MSMGAGRFGIGLVAGLLFALVIVLGSGLVAAVPGSPSAGSKLTSTNLSTSINETTTGTPVYAVTGAASTTSTIVSTSESLTTSGSVPGAKVAPNAESSPQFSSNLATLNDLPTSSRALLLAPIAVAALLGVLLYRTSMSGHGDSEEE